MRRGDGAESHVPIQSAHPSLGGTGALDETSTLDARRVSGRCWRWLRDVVIREEIQNEERNGLINRVLVVQIRAPQGLCGHLDGHEPPSRQAREVSA